MKIYRSWKRNTPDTVTGESLTVTITYSSFNAEEIDELQKQQPTGIIIIESEGETHENIDCSSML